MCINRLLALPPLIAGLLLSLYLPAISALTLKAAVELAQRSDPTFLAAQANLNVSRERAEQAVAGLLPQLNASANSNTNRRNYNQHNPLPWIISTPERYNSHTAQLNLTQPLWRHSNLIELHQAELNVSQADLQLTAAAQDLLLRLAQAWFDAMQARDSVTAAEAQVQAAQQQLEVTQRAHDKGVLSQTELDDARAKHAQAQAEQAIAQSELEIKLAALEQITGPANHTPPVLSEHYKLSAYTNTPLDNWLKQAESNNPALRAAQRAVDAASEEIHKQRAAHEPTLDLVASYSNTVQGAGISGGQAGFDARTAALGLQFNLPLYQGGGQKAKVREAFALRDKAVQELEAARRNARLTAKQAWFTWHASSVREHASRLAIQSAAEAVSGAQLAKARGVKADIDVLQARQQQAVALRDWHKARYDSLLSQIKLKAVCGQLNREDLIVLDQAFTTDK